MGKRLKDNPDYLDQLDPESTELLFTKLLDKLPYKFVIDSFFRYLNKRDREGEDNL